MVIKGNNTYTEYGHRAALQNVENSGEWQADLFDEPAASHVQLLDCIQQ